MIREQLNRPSSSVVLSCAGSPEEVIREAKRWEKKIDAMEIRVDLSSSPVKRIFSLPLVEEISLPLILTFGKWDPKKGKGREFWENVERGIEKERIWMIDLDWETPLWVFHSIQSRFPHIPIILSCHDFLHTPRCLETFLEKVQTFPSAVVKIVTKAQTSIDSLRMAAFVFQKREEGRAIIGICMGDVGRITRMLSSIIGNLLVYVAPSKEKKTADGQLTVEEYDALPKCVLNDPIYGLIGSPVHLSRGEICHHFLLRKMGKRGIYVKMDLSPPQMEEGFFWISKLPFRGLSVTMPLKESILSHVDCVDASTRKIGAVNTLIRREDGQWIGKNTDGGAALDLIEKLLFVNGKKMVIVGAGGVARAIAFEAKKRGASITIVNRNRNRGEILAKEVEGKGEGLDFFETDFPQEFDIFVQATSVGMSPFDRRCLVDEKHLKPPMIVLETIASCHPTELLIRGQKKGCCLIEGIHLYIEQAIAQAMLWHTVEEEYSREELVREVFVHLERENSFPMAEERR